MALKIVKKIIPVSSYPIKSPYAMTPTRIVVHNTANDASAENEVSYMTSNKLKKSFHYAVDDIQAIQAVPENRNSWNAGDGNGKGNREGISIEICYSKSGGVKFTKAESNAVLLIVSILKRYKWDVDKVTKHQDYSGKYCPHRTLDLGWARFLNLILKEMEEMENRWEKYDRLKLTRAWDVYDGTGKVKGKALNGSVCEVISDKLGSLPASLGDIAWLNVKFNNMTGYLQDTKYLLRTGDAVSNLDGSVTSPETLEIAKLTKQVTGLKKEIKTLEETVADWELKYEEQGDLLTEAQGYKKYQGMYINATTALNALRNSRFMWIVEWLEKRFPEKKP